MHNPTLRVLGVLQEITKSPGGIRLADLSRQLQIPKTTLLPIVQTLCQTRYLSADEHGIYSAGTAWFSLGASFSGCFPVLDYVRCELEALVAELGETCYCGTLEDGLVLYLDKVDSPQPLRVLTSTGRRLPAYATSIGKALLLDCGEAELQSLYPNGLTPLTENTITDIPALARQLSESSRTGYTWEIEESTDHVRCFAAPIRKKGRIVAAISVAIPLFRYREEDRERIIETLKSHARQMGATFENTDAHFAGAF